MSANELWDQLRAESSGIGLATVYRALQSGVQTGRLVAVELQAGSVRYEPAELDHHHHFLCSSCERAFDLGGWVVHGFGRCLGGVGQADVFKVQMRLIADDPEYGICRGLVVGDSSG